MALLEEREGKDAQIAELKNYSEQIKVILVKCREENEKIDKT